MAENNSSSNSGANNSGNISQSVNVEVDSSGRGRWYLTKDVLIPVVVALISAAGGGFVKQEFDVLVAPEKTKAETQTLLGLAKEIEGMATANQASLELITKVKQLATQARAIEITASHLQGPRGSITQDVDFWLRQNTTAILGGTIPFGVNDDYFGVPVITVNGNRQPLPAGAKVDYTTNDGQKCFVSFVIKPSEEHLYGFKIECPSPQK